MTDLRIWAGIKPRGEISASKEQAVRIGIMVTNEDQRLAASLRALRRRTGISQQSLAEAAGVSRRQVSRLENERAAALTLGALRQTFAAADARLVISVWWRGAALDRLLDERHASLVERAIAVMARRGWLSEIEVTFSEYGERGSIDILAGHEPTRSALVCEAKGSIGSIGETNRTLDVKTRLAPGLVVRRLGWRPRTVSRVLILPDDATVRRIVRAHAHTLDAAYPARSREVRRWLHSPDGPIRGLWFLSEARSPPGLRV
jgi:transcriptional regulator with XRE-family HTH domain